MPVVFHCFFVFFINLIFLVGCSIVVMADKLLLTPYECFEAQDSQQTNVLYNVRCMGIAAVACKSIYAPAWK